MSAATGICFHDADIRDIARDIHPPQRSRRFPDLGG
jgi:hypothetical protein